MNVLCAVVENRVAALEIEERLPLRLESHAASCLRCQATRARDRRMRRALADLALQTISAPVGLVTSVEAAITARHETIAVSTGRRDVPRIRLASPGAIAGVAAIAAGGAAVAAWRLTKRPA
jgi:anti-sigma factor RsiW